MLFVLVYFHVLRPIATVHLICVFSLLANDMHIVRLALNVLPFFSIIGV
jgi:hypothetical protein